MGKSFCELGEDDLDLDMSPEHLFILAAPLITRQDRNYRNCIPAKKHLVITLRNLADGCSQQGCIFTSSDNLL